MIMIIIFFSKINNLFNFLEAAQNIVHNKFFYLKILKLYKILKKQIELIGLCSLVNLLIDIFYMLWL